MTPPPRLSLRRHQHESAFWVQTSMQLGEIWMRSSMRSSFWTQVVCVRDTCGCCIEWDNGTCFIMTHGEGGWEQLSCIKSISLTFSSQLTEI